MPAHQWWHPSLRTGERPTSDHIAVAEGRPKTHYRHLSRRKRQASEAWTKLLNAYVLLERAKFLQRNYQEITKRHADYSYFFAGEKVPPLFDAKHVLGHTLSKFATR